MKATITDDALLEYLDGMGNETERSAFEKKLRESEAALTRLKELEAVHFFLKSQKGLEQPSKNFTEKVMEGLRTRPGHSYFSPKNGLILLAGLLVASGVALVMLSSGAFDQLHTIFNFRQLPVKTELVKLPTSMPFDVKLFVKAFIMINLIVGFFLLDRTILRPIFQKRSGRLTV